jgi:hypothetical protein
MDGHTGSIKETKMHITLWPENLKKRDYVRVEGENYYES